MGGKRAPRGGASCLSVERPGSGALRPPTARLLRRAGGARYPLAVGAVCGRRGPAVLGSFSDPRFVVCCARFPGLRQPSAIAAGGVPLWRASWRPVGAPCLVWSGCSRCSSRLSRHVGAFPHPGVCRPRFYGVAARGTWTPAENHAHCACRWPLPSQGHWARSASYPFGALRWGCPWRVPPASVLGYVHCGGLACVDPVTDASGFPYRQSFDGGLGRCTGAVSCGRRPLLF